MIDINKEILEACGGDSDRVAEVVNTYRIGVKAIEKLENGQPLNVLDKEGLQLLKDAANAFLDGIKKKVANLKKTRRCKNEHKS